MRLSDLDGVIGKQFRIGYTGKFATLTVNDDGTLTLNLKMATTGLDAGDGAIKTNYVAKDDNDVANMVALKKSIDACTREMQSYTDNKIAEITGGTTGTNVMLTPADLSVDQLAESFSVALGTLPAGKFIDRIIFEVTEPFAITEPNTTYQFSIGSVTAPEEYMTKFSVDELASTHVISINKTLKRDADLVLYAYKVDTTPPPPPKPPFEQKIYNGHSGVTTSMTSDASQKIWSIELMGTDLTGEVLDTISFGEVIGDYMDFAINMPVLKNHRYRITQKNPALEYFTPDETIQNIDGVWTKSREYLTDDTDEDFNFAFVMGAKASEKDYVHIELYDLESETPDQAIVVYHIHNDLKFKEIPEPEILAPVFAYEFLSADEGTVGSVKNDTNDFTLTLSGKIHSKAAEAGFEGLTGKYTKIGLFYPRAVPPEGIRVAVYNPIYEQLNGTDGIKSANGVYYTDMTVLDNDGETGVWIDIPVGETKTYPIVVAVMDLSTKKSFTVGIDNELEFIEDPPTPEEPLPSQTVAYNMPMMAMEYAADGNTGKAIVRVLSF